MEVLNKKSFKLPFVERGIFAKPLRLDLDFDKRQGAYYVENYNEVEKIIDIISDVLGGEKISFLPICLLCGRDFPCSDCKYSNLCETKDLSLQCICENCRATPQLHDEYVKRNLS